eukprot:756410-Hanusia_phi.AAC.1
MEIGRGRSWSCAAAGNHKHSSGEEMRRDGRDRVDNGNQDQLVWALQGKNSIAATTSHSAGGGENSSDHYARTKEAALVHLLTLVSCPGLARPSCSAWCWSNLLVRLLPSYPCRLRLLSLTPEGWVRSHPSEQRGDIFQMKI